jgi:hypothetical protein
LRGRAGVARIRFAEFGDFDDQAVIRAGQVDGVEDGGAGSGDIECLFRVGKLGFDPGALHGEEFAAFFDQRHAPFDEPIEGSDGAGGDDVEAFALIGVGEIFGALIGDGEVGEVELLDRVTKECGFLFVDSTRVK